MKRNLMGMAAAVLAVSPMVAAPAMAASTNPAASLSVSNARVGGSVAKKSELAGGGGILALLIVAGVIAIGVVAIVKDDDADSN